MRQKQMFIAIIVLLVFNGLGGYAAGQTPPGDPAELRLELNPPSPTPTPEPGTTPTPRLDGTPASVAPGVLRLQLSPPMPTPTPGPDATPSQEEQTPSTAAAAGVLRLNLLPLPPTPTPDPDASPTPSDGNMPQLQTLPGELWLSLRPSMVFTPSEGEEGDGMTDEELAARPDILRLTLDPARDDGQGDGEDAGTPDGTGPLPEELVLKLGAETDGGDGNIENGPPAPEFLTTANALWLRFIPAVLQPFQDSLVAYWKLNEGAGMNAWDYSGNRRHGRLTGLTWTPNGLQFSQGYVEIADDDSLNVQDAFTMTAWVYLQDVSGDQKILGKLAPDLGSGFLLRVLDGQLCPMIWDTEETVYVDTWGAIQANAWMHLAVTWERGGDLIGYLNGAEIGRIRASAQPVGTSEKSLIIGADPLNVNAAHVNGIVADVRLYKMPLSAQAIEALATDRTKR